MCITEAVTDHLLQVALGDSDEADDEDVADDRQPSERVRPVRKTGGKQRECNLDEAVEAEFLEHTGVEHRGGAGRGAVAERGPGVERPEGDEDAETEGEQAKDIFLHGDAERLGGEDAAEFNEVETVRRRSSRRARSGR